MGQDQTIFRNSVIKKETPFFILREKEASYSIEAAVSFSVFMFIFITALIYIRLITAQYVIKESMALTARKAAAYGDNIERMADKITEKIPVEGEKNDKAKFFLQKAILINTAKNEIEKRSLAVSYIKGGLSGLDFSKTEITETEINMDCVFTMNIVGDFLSEEYFKVHDSVSARRYVGWTPDMEDNREYVYVTPDGEDYHQNKNCPYLKLSIREISRESIKKARNYQQGIYYKCDMCANDNSTYYYVTTYGTTYHSSLKCSGLKRTLQRITLEEAVEKYRPCPKCSDKK